MSLGRGWLAVGLLLAGCLQPLPQEAVAPGPEPSVPPPEELPVTPEPSEAPVLPEGPDPGTCRGSVGFWFIEHYGFRRQHKKAPYETEFFMLSSCRHPEGYVSALRVFDADLQPLHESVGPMEPFICDPCNATFIPFTGYAREIDFRTEQGGIYWIRAALYDASGELLREQWTRLDYRVFVIVPDLPCSIHLEDPFDACPEFQFFVPKYPYVLGADIAADGERSVQGGTLRVFDADGRQVLETRQRHHGGIYYVDLYRPDHDGSNWTTNGYWTIKYEPDIPNTKHLAIGYSIRFDQVPHEDLPRPDGWVPP